MRQRVIFFGLALLLLLLPLPLCAAPLVQAPQTVRISQVDVSGYPRVTLYVNVVDAAGRVVEGLQAADFQIVEEGQPAGVVDFAGLGEQRPVDIAFVLDTTSSMGSYIEGIKRTIVTFAETLAGRNRDYRLALVTFGDTVRESHPFTTRVDEFVGWVSSQQAEGGGDTPENALGAVQHAAGLSFRPGVQRLIILLTDAPAHHAGDAADEGTTFDDRALTLEGTLALLRRHSLSVHALTYGADADFQALADQTGGAVYSLYEDFVGIVDRLGVVIANQYRFSYESPRPAYDGTLRQVEVTVGGQKGQSTYTTPTSRTPQGPVQFYNALRTPLDISTDPAVIGTNLFLAILIALLFGLTSTVLNDTLNAHQDALERSFLGRIAALFRGLGQLLAQYVGRLIPLKKNTGLYLRIAAFLGVTAFIACFLEPSFRLFTWSSLGVFCAMLVSVGLVNLVYEGSQVVAARRLQLDAALKLNPVGILVALGCVLLSRAVGFVPGYLYGVTGGYALGAAVEMSRRREAAIGGVALGTTMLVALVAWGLTVPTTLLQNALPGGGVGGFFGGLVGGLQDGLLTIFFVGVEVVFLEMFPLEPTNGAVLFAWSKWVWGGGFVVVGFIALHTLLTPDSAYLSTVRNTSLDLLLGMLLIYSLVTVGLWYWFDWRKRRRSVRPGHCPACGRDNPPAASFCGQCGTALSAPDAQKPSRQGLALVIVIGALWGLIVIAVALALVGVA